MSQLCKEKLIPADWMIVDYGSWRKANEISYKLMQSLLFLYSLFFIYQVMASKSKNDKYGKLPKRLKKELARLDKDCPTGIKVTPHDDNFRYFDIEILGPTDTPYEGGTFHIEMFLTDRYPMKPPKCRFLTKIYHPNVDKIGRICLDVLKDKWTPALTVSRLCLSIQCLMQDPNPDDPLDNQVAELWKSNLKEAQRNAIEWTKRYAMESK
eukprot:937648_1